MARFRGALGFEEFYQRRFGERWPTLRAALLAESVPTKRLNSFSIERPELSAAYSMDGASILVAESLLVEPGMRVLDMCAAPGGKSLILAEKLFLAQNAGQALSPADTQSERGHPHPSLRPLVLNELSRARRTRLLRVLSEYLPAEIREQIDVRGYDASRFGRYQPEQFDRILLDAPCSSERHVLSDPAALAAWSEARVQHLAVQQYSLLRSAFASLKPGGVLVYATCALVEDENSRVVGRLLRKSGSACEEEPIRFSVGHAEQFGWSFLPDAGGMGPMYLCRLRKTASGASTG